MMEKYNLGDRVTYRGKSYIVIDWAEAGGSYKLFNLANQGIVLSEILEADIEITNEQWLDNLPVKEKAFYLRKFTSCDGQIFDDKEFCGDCDLISYCFGNWKKDAILEWLKQIRQENKKENKE